MITKYRPLLPREEHVARLIVDCAFKVHKGLGPGLLESVYESCFCYELHQHHLAFERQMPIRAQYGKMEFESAFRLDVLVEGCIICELKSVEALSPIHTAQLLSYLKLSEKRLGFLINFNVPAIRKGIKRIIL